MITAVAFSLSDSADQIGTVAIGSNGQFTTFSLSPIYARSTDFKSLFQAREDLLARTCSRMSAVLETMTTGVPDDVITGSHVLLATLERFRRYFELALNAWSDHGVVQTGHGQLPVARNNQLPAEMADHLDSDGAHILRVVLPGA